MVVGVLVFGRGRGCLMEWRSRINLEGKMVVYQSIPGIRTIFEFTSMVVR